MDFSGYSIAELIELYSGSIKELKKRGILRTKNVIGELGEYLVLEQYLKNPSLPNLKSAPIGTKNINALSMDGDRYSIKSTSGNVTGVFYGLQNPDSNAPDKQVFEYVVICKLDEDCELEGIYELTWEGFLKHKRWHSRMQAWNLTLTKALKQDARVIYDKNATVVADIPLDDIDTNTNEDDDIDQATEDAELNDHKVIVWNKTDAIDHKVVRSEAVIKIQKKLHCEFTKTSASRYVSQDNTVALFVMSAKYNAKNKAYWYSINDENFPWFDVYPKCYLAFAMGSSDNVLLFTYQEVKELLAGCLRTQDDETIGKKAHYHFYFDDNGENKVYFKKKKPVAELIDVTKSLV